MIKRIRFVTRREYLTQDDFRAAWVDCVALAQYAPAAARPARVVACIALHHVEGTAMLHDGMSMEWFEDIAALQRFEAWLRGEEERAASVVMPHATVVIRAEEVVMRGADWLEARWAQPGVKLKHMALARRAPGLDPLQFSAQWRMHAGRIGGQSQLPIIIPDEARGRAYIQNHPLPNTEEWRYDAVTEVYFDDLAAMRARVDFFRAHDVASSEPLVHRPVFVAVSEHPIVINTSLSA